MNKKKQVTLGDIAEIVKLSKVAVSKALRDHPDISSDTKIRIKETAEQLGYVPNINARNLSSKRSYTIGMVVPKVAHHFFARAIESIYETAYANDYEVIMTVSQENAKNEIKHIQSLLAMHVDGLLVSVTENTKDAAIFKAVRKRGVPLVFFDRVLKNIGFSCVTTNDMQGSIDAVSYLVNAGFKKMAHLSGRSFSNIGKDRLEGFKNAVKKFDLNIPDSWIVEGGFGERSGYLGFRKIFKSGKMPEVIYAVTYPVALGAMMAANELGLKIPDDIDIFSFGGSNYNHFIKPSLSFVDQPVREIGKSAVELLLNEIRNPDSRPSTLELPAELIICETCLKKTGYQFNEQI